jgi:transcriptional regulator with XRE-family HTH domain
MREAVVEKRAIKTKETMQSRYEIRCVGERVRTLRLAKALTVSRLAELSHVPASTISKIEHGLLRPSLVHAINLAEALGENLGFLVDRYRDRPEPFVVVHGKDRNTIDYPQMELALQDLNGHFLPGLLESRIGILGLGAHSGIGPMTHQGEEFCTVLSGAIRYCIDDENYELAAGDYIQFKSDLRHSWENAHVGETRVLWVFSDGPSF